MNKIVIYGLGRLGTSLFQFIEEFWSDEVKIVQLIDNNKSDFEFRWRGIPLKVFGEEELLFAEFDYLLLSIRKNSSIYRRLAQKYGNKRIIAIEEGTTYSDLYGKYFLLKKLADKCLLNAECLSRLTFEVSFITLCVGNACTLKCRDCGNFCPDAPDWAKQYDPDMIISHMDKVLDSVDTIAKVQVQGGEPFIYPSIGSILEYLIKQEKIKHLQIATNGTIMPEEKVLELCKNQKVEIRISNYGAINKSQGAKLAEYLREVGINNRIYNFAGEDAMWYALGGDDFPKTISDIIVKERFNNCAFNSCLTLENGRISHCSRAYQSEVLRKFDAKEGAYFNIEDYSEKVDFRTAFRKFCFEKSFMEACRYCAGTCGTEKVPAAIQKQR